MVLLELLLRQFKPWCQRLGLRRRLRRLLLDCLW